MFLHLTEKSVSKEYSRQKVLMTLVQFCNIIPQMEGPLALWEEYFNPVKGEI